MTEAQQSDPVSTKQQRIAGLAERRPQEGFTALNHHLDRAWLVEASNRTRKDAAPGVDGQTAQAYGLQLLENLQGLLGRAQSGTYRASPVRRVHIAKGTGKELRPLGIPTLADKILQRAVATVLEPVDAQDFLDGSYGFRPGRSAHQALPAVWQQALDLGGCWLVEVDIQRFFDTRDRAHRRTFLQQRVRDGVLPRLIGKWRQAGILAEGELVHAEAGTPQGGVISPLLANVYLHYLVDVWFAQAVKPCLKGRAFLVRYADDLVMGFACEADARRVLDVLPKRFGKYGLTLHPEKTRLLRFVRPGGRTTGTGASQGVSPESFDFLGFTHYWSRSKKGSWVIKHKTARGRLRRALRKVADWFRRHLHEPIAVQYRALQQELRGHYQYCGVVGNGRSLWCFRERLQEVWQKWLSRRRRGGGMTWERMSQLLRGLPLLKPPAWVAPCVAKP